VCGLHQKLIFKTSFIKKEIVWIIKQLSSLHPNRHLKSLVNKWSNRKYSNLLK